MSFEPKEMILTAGPSISEKEINYVNDAVANGWNNKWNEYLNRFETAFAEYVGVKHAIATSSCTGALHLSLRALGISEGDEVLVPEITWIATAASVTYCGAKPVFVDIDADSWCMDPVSIKKNITSKTKAIMPVHNYGNVCDMDAIMAIAKSNNLFVVEDAAPSLGAVYKGKKTGSFGDTGAFSFQGAKIMTTGEGGMFVTNDTVIFDKAKKLGDHGRSFSKVLWNDDLGLKYKMSNIQAALGLGQLERIEEFIEKKRQIFSWYKNGLGDIDGLKLNSEAADTRNIYWMPSMIMSKEFGVSRDDVIARLREKKVDSRPVFYPMSSFSMFETRKDNLNAIAVSAGGINLPAGFIREEEEIDYICKCVREILGA